MGSRKRLVLIPMLVAFLLSADSAGARTFFVGGATDTSDFPIAYAYSRVVHRPSYFHEVFSAIPFQSLDWTEHMYCWRGNKSRSRNVEYRDLPGKSYTYRLTLRHPDACTISESVTFTNLETPGTISVSMYAHQRKRR